MTYESIQQRLFGKPGDRVCRRQEGFWVRSGTTTACVVCGLNIPSALTWAHVHDEDRVLVENRADRVFRLCWNHHHGFYDQGYISAAGLLDAEDVWIANKERPMPHPRDQDIINKVLSGALERRNRWTENKKRNAALKQAEEQEQAVPDAQRISRSYSRHGRDTVAGVA